MTDTVDALILDLLEWIGPGTRAYAEVMEAWRTSCPRLPVWEEANARGLVERRHIPGGAARIAVSAAGIDFLCAGGRAGTPAPGRRGARK